MLYASVGAELTAYEVDVDAATLTPGGSVSLPANVQYAWPHPSRRWLYVASSNGGPGSGGAAGDQHHLSAFRIGPGGALAPHGPPQRLPARPIHMALDTAGAFALTAYNNPSSVTVHAIAGDGTVGAAVPQPGGLDAGIYAHQIRATPSNRQVILVTRGNDAAGGKPEDPGALKLYDFAAGRLANRASVAPGGGFGFGPRHLDFHPAQPWVYVGIERQNQLQLYDLGADGNLAATPRSAVSTLHAPTPAGVHQIASAIHVHPNGRFVYVANRADTTRPFQGKPVLAGGENTLAVFALDPRSGAPSLIQSAETRSIHVRTFSIDPSGRLLIAGSIRPGFVPDGDSIRAVPAALSLFRIGADGKLAYQRKLDIEVGEQMLFWSGMV